MLNRGLLLLSAHKTRFFLQWEQLIGRGDMVAILEPDYFANRKLVEFFEDELVPVQTVSVMTASGLVAPIMATCGVSTESIVFATPVAVLLLPM